MLPIFTFVAVTSVVAAIVLRPRALLVVIFLWLWLLLILDINNTLVSAVVQNLVAVIYSKGR